MAFDRRRYVITETVISVTINAAFSAGFVWLIFGGLALVPVWGSGGLLVDFVPQTFMIALMSVFVPTVITRKRVRSGEAEQGPAFVRLPGNLFFRALLIALVAVVVLGGAAGALLAVSTEGPLPMAAVVPMKTLYGALAAALITPIAVRAALADRLRPATSGS